MKLLVRIFGIALIVFGLMWSLQGLGILMWPPESFMLAQREWGLYGAVTAFLGLVLLGVSTRIGRKR